MSGPWDVFWLVVFILLVIVGVLVLRLELRRRRRAHRRWVQRVAAEHRAWDEAATLAACEHLDRTGVYDEDETHLRWVCLTCGATGVDVTR